MKDLDYMYEEGWGVKQDYKEMRRRWGKAASLGNKETIKQLKRLGMQP